jgi:hypothetical protein
MLAKSSGSTIVNTAVRGNPLSSNRARTYFLRMPRQMFQNLRVWYMYAIST